MNQLFKSKANIDATWGLPSSGDALMTAALIEDAIRDHGRMHSFSMLERAEHHTPRAKAFEIADKVLATRWQPCPSKEGSCARV